MKKILAAFLTAVVVVMFSAPLMAANNGNAYGHASAPGQNKCDPCFTKSNSGIGNGGENPTEEVDEPGGQDIDPGNSGQQSQGGKNDMQDQYNK